MAVSRKPTVLVLGHSFVDRIRRFACTRNEGTSLDFGLHCHVVFNGKGGRRIHDLWSELDNISAISPDIVVIDIGTNDLALPSSIPGELADLVFQFARHLFSQCDVKVIYIAQIFRRLDSADRTPVDFNNRVFTYNAALRCLCLQGQSRSPPLPIYMFTFDGMSLDWRAYLDIRDGVHFTVCPVHGMSHSGSYKYYRSLKSCIYFALRMSCVSMA